MQKHNDNGQIIMLLIMSLNNLLIILHNIVALSLFHSAKQVHLTISQTLI